jgi:pyruvate, orthophosphate dikinase
VLRDTTSSVGRTSRAADIRVRAKNAARSPALEPSSRPGTRARPVRLGPARIPALPKGLTAADRATLEAIRARKLPAYRAVDALVKLVDDGKLTPKDAILLVDAGAVGRFHLPTFKDHEDASPIARMLGVSDGCASGVVVFDPEEAKRRGQAGESVILAIDRPEPEDIDAFKYVAGVIGREADTSAHAAVIARELGKPTIASWSGADASGAGDLEIDPGRGRLEIGGQVIRANDPVSIDGTTGDLFRGLSEVTTHAARPSFGKLIHWAKGMIGLGVLANADGAASIERAFAFGATGIGLVRTEHMFFGDRLKTLQAAILAEGLLGHEERVARLAQLTRIQQADFEDIFRVAKGREVTIRLLDPPLHEILPKVSDSRDNAFTPDQFGAHFGIDPAKAADGMRRTFGRWKNVDLASVYAEVHQDPPDLIEVAKDLEVSPYSVRREVERFRQANPMLGLRGVRLGVKAPEFYEMQADALFRAAAAARARGQEVDLRILVPMVNSVEELTFVRRILEKSRAQVERETTTKLEYRFGAMIETPEGALKAKDIAAHCDFFSFGTNDLTQATYGLSRDDAHSIEEAYRDAGFEARSPFETIDRESVGALIKIAMAAAKGDRRAARDFTGGICGEQGADPETIAHARDWGVDYVSVSPYRVASAILASAQARLAHQDESGPAAIRVRRKDGGR